ncbi:type II secretion system protein GspE [Syntrophotalea acetylenivorans]|uniref:protein-secreting ATPase n=1 Tax=Syntrophotalea acetylenivorans TaxID=1842532 RepID=A0A1L3GPQ5_9BACT|nr:type II secretion system ATPase GspE [Syntrophotalea acetylenivorans]APG27912.1 type II secretion system protein GspE [Syntrophotalea acetylenivorans]
MSIWKPLGEILQQQCSVPAAAIEQALTAQQQSQLRLGELLIQAKAIDSATLARALALQLDLPFCDQITEPAEDELLKLIPIAFAKEHRIFPIKRNNGRLKLAIADPLDGRVLNDLTTLTGCQPDIVVASAEEILQAINRGYEQHADKAQNVAEEISDSDSSDQLGKLEPADLLDASDEGPIIRFVNSMLTQAYKERASDIHIEPFETDLVVRYRIDGILYEVLRPPAKAQASISSRIKIMANLNIAEKRLPQDGRFGVRIAGKDVDVRVSTLPTAFGERIVLRLLDKSTNVLTLEEIGMGPVLLRQVHSMIRKSHGIFLVTGPTGSGKTTTLYAALSLLNSREKNIITVEDPIEYQLEGVGQIQVNPKIELTFAAGLRSILRQDPDIIMVGEIRDTETAEIAVQSALTGHMVFSTLHTNDAAGALTRLVEMGIEPFLAASSIVGVLAQRLVRNLCPHCRETYQPSPELLREAGLSQELPTGSMLYRAVGCDQCMDIGYRGRSGIYELLTIDEKVRDLLLQNQDAGAIKRASLAAGMTSLREAGIAKALAGETSIEEVLRVTQEET